MRHPRPISTVLLAALGFASALAYSQRASAQADLTPPLPNVLLLVDTSGSMEYLPDGTLPKLDAQKKCLPPGPGGDNQNRWAKLLSVLTGTFQNYSCYAQPRDSASPFVTEYSISGTPPYDRDYHLPFHRILSNDCTPGPGDLDPTWSTWPNDAIKFHGWNDAGAACAAPGFQQTADGLLDTFADRARFGLMTFDPLTDAGTGAAGNSYDALTGVAGTWSYYLGWQGAGSPASGNPPNCAAQPYEVGARNPAAPPWEGRLMPFGDPDATAATLLAQNQRLQLALLGMRPYGATPLAGMLDDARDFIYNDPSMDLSTGKKFGPAGDPYFTGGCRKTFVIVLSDGEPNLDLRKEGCATGNGQCPYSEPHVIAADMANSGDPDTRVVTFAIGFGLSSAAGTDCNTLGAADFGAGGKCDGATGALAACCTLARIADEGGTQKAYFADDEAGLKSALSLVLGQITSSSKTRTIPAFGSTAAGTAALGNADAVGYRFGAQFDTPLGSPLWVGRLVRERYTCTSQGGGPKKSAPQPVDGTKGDNFARNVNANDASNPRRFFTVVGDKVGGQITSVRSIRPKLAAAGIDDGMGLYSGVATNSGVPEAGPQFATTVSVAPEAFGINPAFPPNACTTQLGTSSAATCTQRLMRWEVGEIDPGLPTRDFAGCKVTDPISGQQMGCELGSIFRSTPVVIGPPNEFLRDESYDQFALAQAGRPTMLYVQTTDGQLHAFKVAANNPNDTLKVDALQNNELWSFLPPAVLPKLLTTYNQQSILLDGQVVVQDVVLERTAAQAISGTGAGGPTWRTILLAGGGAGGGFYFALDVTDPTKPEFLWQISEDFEGAEAFGSQVPTPAIATITLGPAGNAAKEVAVAILPGGSDPLQAGACPRLNPPPYPQITGSTPRSFTRCWQSGPGRSISIVRLDTGEVIRTFVSPKGSISPNLSSSRRTVAPFDSPLTGTPVPYPAKGGQISTRVYVGDADGTLWRINLSKPDPQEWTVDMMWDAYSGLGAEDGEPIQTPPVVSIDNFGQPVLLFSTGDQEIITSTTPITRVLSLTESVSGATFSVKSNFQIDMSAGERVTGPISLFSGTAYFSSFAPQPIAVASGTCTYGEGKLWGVDYRTGEGRLDPLNTSIKSQSQGPNSIVFGVAVTQTPSCADTTSFDSAYFGGYVGVSGGSPGDFQLVYQVSGQPAGQQQNGAAAVFNTKTLPAPRVTTRIDSWAAVVE
jgi:type IV pilus assembly protein PilY1